MGVTMGGPRGPNEDGWGRRLVVLLIALVARGVCQEECKSFDQSHGSFNITLNGQLTTRLVVGTQIDIACDLPVYGPLYGHNQVECVSGGVWRPVTPGCDRWCEHVFPTEHLRVQGIEAYSTYPYARTEFFCDAGYILIGNTSIQCLPGGSWSNPVPTCISGRTCVSFDTSHGNFTFERNVTSALTIYTVVRYSCLPPYLSVHMSTFAQCIDNGITSSLVWSLYTPECELPCPPLPTIDQIYYYPEERYPGATVNIRCTLNHRLIGPSSTTCSRGNWTAYPIGCHLITCPAILTPLHASYTYTRGNETNVVGASVEFSCSSGYHLVGFPYLRCQAAETWSDDIPQCEPDVCSGIVIGEYGSVTYSNASHGVGTVATVSCDPSYEPVNGFTTATCVAGAMWSPDVLQCDRSCPALSPTENLHYNSTATYPGASVTATCDYGFFLRGSFTLQCVIGSWSDSPPTCIRTQVAFCPPLVPSTNLVMRGSDRAVGSTWTFECSNGWQLSGASSITCLSNHQWSASTPACYAAVTATTAPTSSVSTPTSSVSTPTSSVSTPTSSVSTPTTNVTTPTGPVTCPPYKTDDGYLIVNDDPILPGAWGTLMCRSLRPFNNQDSYVCQEDGSWAPLYGYSRLGCGYGCPDIDAPNTQKNTSNAAPEISVSISCVGSTETVVLHCIGATGRWDRDPPTCSAVTTATTTPTGHVTCPPYKTA